MEPDRGLGSAEVEARRAVHGANAIVEQRSRPWWRMYLDQLRDFMIVVLVGAAIVSGVVGDLADSVAIVVIVLLNAVVGFVQEYRAERAVAALKGLASPLARVVRDGLPAATVPIEELVPGDVVMLDAGDFVPADVRLLETVETRIDEAPLTGESAPVDKRADVLVEAEQPVSDRADMAFFGTLVTHGRARGVVVGTGMSTELGRIAALLGEPRTLKTPLQRRLAGFGRRLAVAVLVVCAVVFAAGLLRGEPAVLMFLTAVSLAVAAIPEALPAVVTVALAQGARRMVRRSALVRHLPAVETLGSVTTICSDKTGTLTRNEMVAAAFFAGGERRPELPRVLEAAEPWSSLARALVLNNDTVLDDRGELAGDPTETALFAAAVGAGVARDLLDAERRRVAEIPFDAERKRMTTFHANDGACLAVTKGAPESVLPNCRAMATVNGVTPLDPVAIAAEVDALARRGYRVLAFATRSWPCAPSDLEPESVETELVFLGLAALVDPPREEAAESIAQCRAAGITPVMITGDHPRTAEAIARQLGIADEGELAVTGRELASGARELAGAHVYARVSPEQKIEIVEALQARGEIVAMTGDGVNDAPALRRADIGVAMGRKGTDVAREASEMILLDDNFATITGAVREGRRIYDNVRKFLKYTMTSNAGEIWVLFLAPFFGLPLPLLPIQILWINLVTDGLPGLALSAEREERGVMQRPPRPPAESVFARGVWQHVLWCGILIGVLSLAAQSWAIHAESDSWRTVVFTVLTLSQLVHALAIRADRDSLLAIGIGSNRLLLGAVLLTLLLQGAAIYVPFFGDLLGTAPLSLEELAVCVTLPWTVLVAVELEKALVRRGWIYRDRTASGVHRD